MIKHNLSVLRTKIGRLDLSFLRKYAVVFVLLGLIVLFSLLNDRFLTVRNLSNIVSQNTYFVIVAVGMSFVLISGGIDLSVGFQMSLVGILTAMMMVLWGFPVWAAIILGVIIGTLLGLVNGLIVTRIRTFPLIVTLATSVIFKGISYIVSGARTFRDYPASFQFITRGRLFGVTFDVYLALFIVILAAFIFYKTTWGIRVVALGGNEEALRLAGVNTRRLKAIVYTVCGFFTAIAHGRQAELHGVIARTRHRVHSLDGCYRRRRQLPGGRGQHPGAGGRRVRAGGPAERHAALRLGHQRPVHRNGRDPPCRRVLRRVPEDLEDEAQDQVIAGEGQ
jgi:ribose/xylose/arabinose/galactoside ABC-type transport system permease subunit